MKPYVILNAAMTLDGKIATATGSSKISGKKDLIRVHKLRREVDGIMVGINTVLVDNPRLTAHKVNAPLEDNPTRIIIDSKGRTPLDYKVLNNDAPTIIAMANNYESHFNKDTEVFKSGTDKVDLKELMKYLYNKGIKTIMLEGGSTLNFSMLKDNLIDEVRICIGPMIVGGSNAKTLFDGEGFDDMSLATKLELTNSINLDKDLILIYKVKK